MIAFAENRPTPSAAVLEGMFIVWRGLFSQAELDSIERHGDSLAHQDAGMLAGTDGYDAARVTKVAWIGRDDRSEALFHKLEEVVLAINAQFFRYDLSGIMALQYTIYNEAEGSRFGWHQDYGVNEASGGETRKLTLSLQLSNGADYEGCELQTQLGDKQDSAPRERGTLVGFPAYVPHRVTPIVAGTRKCLVIWAVGPELR
ncbi:MAG: putative 2OG-Fe(II) oxygenase [Alphaproteobacteria bacterium]|nr:putative 2OG-Fe(II) oxygenase [Alphaproteobacteria bacterium]